MKQQILVIHGGGSYAKIPREDLIRELQTIEVDINRLRRTEDWKANLQSDLGDTYDILSPRMPNPDQPLFEEWKTWFEQILKVLDNEIIVVGHSLGAVFLLKYFSEYTTNKKVRGLFSVAAPYNMDVENERYRKSGFFMNKDTELNLSSVDHVFLYHSHDDPVVPFSELEKYKEKLPNAIVRELEGRKHVNGASFPEIVEDILSIN